MSIKGVKLKSESYFLLSPGILELWRKNLRGADSAPLGPDSVKCLWYKGNFNKPNIFSNLLIILPLCISSVSASAILVTPDNKRSCFRCGFTRFSVSGESASEFDPSLELKQFLFI